VAIDILGGALTRRAMREGEGWGWGKVGSELDKILNALAFLPQVDLSKEGLFFMSLMNVAGVSGGGTSVVVRVEEFIGVVVAFFRMYDF